MPATSAVDIDAIEFYHINMAEVITIDGSGRIVIPARVRRALALAKGSQLELEVEDSAIRLRPVANARVEKRGQRLVITSPLVGPTPDHRELREERVTDIAGGDE